MPGSQGTGDSWGQTQACLSPKVCFSPDPSPALFISPYQVIGPLIVSGHSEESEMSLSQGAHATEGQTDSVNQINTSESRELG